MFGPNEVKSELFLGEPPQELLDWAKKHIREDPDTRCQMLSEFRDMIFARGECEPHRTDDAFLLRFLRARHYNLESAYKLFINYFEFRETNYEDFFKGVNLSLLEQGGQTNIISVPPYREQTGRRILLYRLGLWNPEMATINDVMRATMIILELAILEQQAQILGGICIFDMSDLTLQQIWHMSPSMAQKVVQIMVTSFPMQVHAVHIVFQSWVFESIYNIFKPFIDDRMKQRLFFHGDNMASLHKHIDPKHLPARYGGVHPDYDYADWIQSFRSNPQIMSELNSLGYREDEKRAC